jgi:hypothetical protein
LSILLAGKHNPRLGFRPLLEDPGLLLDSSRRLTPFDSMKVVSELIWSNSAMNAAASSTFASRMSTPVILCC